MNFCSSWWHEGVLPSGSHCWWSRVLSIFLGTEDGENPLQENLLFSLAVFFFLGFVLGGWLRFSEPGGGGRALLTSGLVWHKGS